MAQRRSKHLLPGFGLTLGVSMLYLTIIIVLPLLAMVLKVGGMGWEEFWRIVASNRSMAAYRITFTSALVATVLNGCSRSNASSLAICAGMVSSTMPWTKISLSSG